MECVVTPGNCNNGGFTMMVRLKIASCLHNEGIVTTKNNGNTQGFVVYCTGTGPLELVHYFYGVVYGKYLIADYSGTRQIIFDNNYMIACCKIAQQSVF